MAALKDFLPVALFFIVYKFTDIYTATTVIIVTVLLQSAYQWYRHGRVTRCANIDFGAVGGFWRGDSVIP